MAPSKTSRNPSSRHTVSYPPGGPLCDRRGQGHWPITHPQHAPYLRRRRALTCATSCPAHRRYYAAEFESGSHETNRRYRFCARRGGRCLWCTEHPSPAPDGLRGPASSEGRPRIDHLSESAERISLILGPDGDSTPHKFGRLIVDSPLTSKAAGRSGGGDAINQHAQLAGRIRYGVEDRQGVV